MKNTKQVASDITPLSMIDFAALLSSFVVMYLCTTHWSLVYDARFATTPPVNTTQNVGFVKSSAKSNTLNLPASRPMRTKPENPPSVPAMSVASMSAVEPIRRIDCTKSLQITASTPPTVQYRIVMIVTATMAVFTSTFVTAAIAMAGR